MTDEDATHATMSRRVWIVAGLGLFACALTSVMFLATLITTVPVISPPIVPEGSWEPPAPPRISAIHGNPLRGDGEDGGELPPVAE
jgi:hypothetical protein